MGIDISGRIYLKDGATKKFDVDRNYAFFEFIDDFGREIKCAQFELSNVAVRRMLEKINAQKLKGAAFLAIMQENTRRTLEWITEHIDDIVKIKYYYS